MIIALYGLLSSYQKCRVCIEIDDDEKGSRKNYKGLRLRSHREACCIICFSWRRVESHLLVNCVALVVPISGSDASLQMHTLSVAESSWGILAGDALCIIVLIIFINVFLLDGLHGRAEFSAVILMGYSSLDDVGTNGEDKNDIKCSQSFERLTSPIGIIF